MDDLCRSVTAVDRPGSTGNERSFIGREKGDYVGDFRWFGEAPHRMQSFHRFVDIGGLGHTLRQSRIDKTRADRIYSDFFGSELNSMSRVSCSTAPLLCG